MRKFIFAAAAAVAIGLGSANTADAQVVYGYNTFVPGVGVVSGRTAYTPFSYGTTYGYATPYGIARQSYYTDVFGGNVYRTGGYNPYTGIGYNRGYYSTPGMFVGPYYTGPYARSYSYFYRR